MGRTVKVDKNLLAGKPAKPKNLSASASEAWDRLVGELAASNIQMTPAHRTVLSQAATISADIAEAWVTVQREGAYINGKAGLVAHPAGKRLDALRRDYIKVLAMLGLRTAVAAPEHKEESLADALADSMSDHNATPKAIWATLTERATTQPTVWGRGGHYLNGLEA